MKKCVRATTYLLAGISAFLLTMIAIVQYTIPNMYWVPKGSSFTLTSSYLDTAVAETGNQSVEVTKMSPGSTYHANVSLFGIVPVKQVTVEVMDEIKLTPCGTPFGIKMFTSGVVIVGMNDIETDHGSVNPAKDAGLKIGDAIVSIDGQTVLSNEDVAALVQKSSGKELTVIARRNDQEFTAKVKPAKSKTDSGYKVGLWVRDSSAGIGTMTFYNQENGTFGGLGHAICDVDTGEILPLMSGEVIDVKITGVVKGQSGTPGELKGAFLNDITRGNLQMNTETGIFGTLMEKPVTSDPIPLAMKQEVREGSAQIITTVDGSGPQFYDIKIEKINYSDQSPTKNMVIKITDQRLKLATGGIVQGMSGSPIIQDGKLVGAVTHVFVNDPLKGYGIFAENMYRTSENVQQSTQQNAA